MIPVPLEVEVHTVPCFKPPVNAKVGPGGLKCGGTFKRHCEFGSIKWVFSKQEL